MKRTQEGKEGREKRGGEKARGEGRERWREGEES